MGRLFDEEKLEKYIIHDGCEKGCGYIDERDLKCIPTVEAIPKDQYKADMVAMLIELKNKLIDKSWNIDMYDDDLDFECCYLNDIDEIIQQKIDKLKENMG